MNHEDINLTKCEYLVIDEADRMLDQGFGPEVEQIIAKMPTERISLMFSATFPDDVQQLSQSVLKKGYYFVTVGVAGSASKQVTQEFHLVRLINVVNLTGECLSDLQFCRKSEALSIILKMLTCFQRAA